ncbi:S-adenosylmethionine decarboxylase proenzyme [Leptospira broomii serovar Hurstbridge str. 5399]|uniref:S-adenosylmethionine decarboxylase proenzyme n=1 Tax=Leptospira broomii serovar Hurstbridge str. 5399 TaxID=1049789 RepID=T0EYW6_9LEPT|nr:adenosylmethionine decarboxylase [Leptospira broomii]EQA44050.1 S-adenosylmethionine decarboxylase proenzyme [Leptospira broomii serovar Hurstbridge str. 5399]
MSIIHTKDLVKPIENGTMELEKELGYEFYGRHLMTDFVGCQIDLDDAEQIAKDMEEAIVSIGATILNKVEHRFDPHGVTILFLLSESHASIHTYPEFNSCFLDIFTCGKTIDVIPFGAYLQNLWKPTKVINRYEERSA